MNRSIHLEIITQLPFEPSDPGTAEELRFVALDSGEVQVEDYVNDVRISSRGIQLMLGPERYEILRVLVQDKAEYDADDLWEEELQANAVRRSFA